MIFGKKKPLEEMKNSELEELSEHFTKDGERAGNILSKREQELISFYGRAYKAVEQGLYKTAVDNIDAYCKAADKYGAVVKQFVYDLLIMAVIDGEASEAEVLWVYDEIIKYYHEQGIVEYVADYSARKNDYIKEVERMQALRERYNFDVTVDLAKALIRLEGLKVNEYRMDDYSTQDSFDAVWRSVLHEVDLFEEGEESPLNKTTEKGAKRWLKEFSHLCKDVRIPEEYKPKEG